MNGPLRLHDVDAERALLGILIGEPDLAETCGVLPGDLAPGLGHPEVLSALLSVHERTGSAEPVLLLDELRRRDQLARIGHAENRGALYLHELVAGRPVGTPGGTGHYARIVRGATARRELWTVGTQLIQAADSEADIDAVLDRAADLSAVLGLLVDEPLDGDTPIAGLSSIGDFVGEACPPHAWVIPGIVEREDRVMLIAGEGVGKSTVARQLCVLLAAGVHPFAPTVRIQPRRTLLVDLENPVAKVRRSLRGMVTQVWDRELDVGDRAWRWTLPGGMDLRSTADRQLLARAIEMTRPDLVAIGPVYKAYAPRPNDSHETGPAEFGRAIDQLRARYQCAFWIEHHPPKGDSAGRRSDPIGSSFWLRWPEFGLVLKRADNAEAHVYEVARFRGDRDERAFPERLLRTGHIPGAWPWTSDFEPDTKAGLFDAIDEDMADQLPTGDPT